MKKEIYSSFELLEVGGKESGYKVYKVRNHFLVKIYSLSSKTTMFQIYREIDWADPLMIGAAEVGVNNGAWRGAVHYKGRWWSTDMINKIQIDRQDYNWRAYV